MTDIPCFICPLSSSLSICSLSLSLSLSLVCLFIPKVCLVGKERLYLPENEELVDVQRENFINSRCGRGSGKVSIIGTQKVPMRVSIEECVCVCVCVCSG